MRGVHVRPYLPDDALDTWQWQTLIVGFNNPLEQVVTQHLKHHAHIWDGESRIHISMVLLFTHSHTHTATATQKQDTNAVYSRDFEVIYQLNNHVFVGVVRIALPHLQDRITMSSNLTGRINELASFSVSESNACLLKQSVLDIEDF